MAELRIFGCDAYVHTPKELRSKLEPKASKCIFLGYAPGSKAYRLYDPQKRRLIKSRDVLFDEKIKSELNDVSIILIEGEQCPNKMNQTDSSQRTCSSDKDQNETFEDAQEQISDKESEIRLICDPVENVPTETLDLRRSTRDIDESQGNIGI